MKLSAVNPFYLSMDMNHIGDVTVREKLPMPAGHPSGDLRDYVDTLKQNKDNCEGLRELQNKIRSAANRVLACDGQAKDLLPQGGESLVESVQGNHRVVEYASGSNGVCREFKLSSSYCQAQATFDEAGRLVEFHSSSPQEGYVRGHSVFSKHEFSMVLQPDGETYKIAGDWVQPKHNGIQS